MSLGGLYLEGLIHGGAYLGILRYIFIGIAEGFNLLLTDPVCSMTSSNTHRDHCLSWADPLGAWGTEFYN